MNLSTLTGLLKILAQQNETIQEDEAWKTTSSLASAAARKYICYQIELLICQELEIFRNDEFKKLITNFSSFMTELNYSTHKNFNAKLQEKTQELFEEFLKDGN